MMTPRQRVFRALAHDDGLPWQIDLTTAFAEKLCSSRDCSDPELYLGNHLVRAKYKANEIMPDGRERDLFGVTWEADPGGGDVGVVSGFPMRETTSFDDCSLPEVRHDFASELCDRLEQRAGDRFTMFSLTMCFFERAWSLRGYNEEDDFGFSFGYFKHQSQWVGAPLIDPEGPPTEQCVAWRFFGPDPVPFESSLHIDFGSRADYAQSVLYYYKVLNSEAPRIISPAKWEIRAPFRCLDFNDFTRRETDDEVAKAPFQQTLASSRGWVDVRHSLRANYPLWKDIAKAYVAQDRSVPGAKDRLPVSFSIYARSSITSDAKKTADLRLAFDDWMSLWLNDRKITTLRHDKGFAISRIPVTLEKGENKIQIKLNNTDNREYRLWAFHCAVETLRRGATRTEEIVGGGCGRRERIAIPGSTTTGVATQRIT